MDYEQAVNRLWNHSNLPRQFNSEDESLLFCLYKAERDNQPPSFDHLVEDVIHCLDVVNHELNGANPSKSVGRANDAVEAQVSYPISEIISGILLRYRKWQRGNLFSQSILDSLIGAALKIAYVWDQVLAGDIDDLFEDLEIMLSL